MNYVINPDSTNTATVLAKAQADAVPTSRKQHPKGEGVTDAGSHPELTEESVRAAGYRWRAWGGGGGKLGGAGEHCRRSQEADSGSGVLRRHAGGHTHTKRDAKVTNHAPHRSSFTFL